MEIILYSFPKEPNSTAQPASDGGLPVQGRLREPSSIEAPAIEFQNVEPVYNYAYIPIWNRYYFIEDWTAMLPLWLASMQVDVLASFKAEIGASTQYVLRSASQFDGRIIDTSYPIIADAESIISTTIVDTPWNFSAGCYVVGVRGEFTQFYSFHPALINPFFEFIFSDAYADALYPGWPSTYPEIKVLLNPMQYISSITWFPFQYIGAGTTSIAVGWVQYPGGADAVEEGGIFHFDPISFTIPRHPQSESRGTYLNIAPFSRYQLFFPPWGGIPIDPSIAAASSSIQAEISVDMRTGSAVLDAKSDSGLLLARASAQLGVSCEYSQIVSPGFGVGNLAATAFNAASSVVSGNYLGALGGVLTSIADATLSTIPAANSLGTSGGASSLVGKAALQAEFLNVASEDIQHRGRPLCQAVQISNLSGYVLCANAEISIAGTYDERRRITQFMEGGFIYA